MESVTAARKFGGSSQRDSHRKLTEVLWAAQKVDGSLQKVSWPHGKLTEVDGRSIGHTEC